MFDRTKLLNIGGGVLPRSWQYSSSDDITTNGYFPSESRIQSGDKLTHVVYDRDNATYNTTSYFVDKDDDGILSVQEIPGSGSANLKELEVDSHIYEQIIIPAPGWDGYNKVTVHKVTSAIDPNITAANIVNGVDILGVIGSAQTGDFVGIPRAVVNGVFSIPSEPFEFSLPSNATDIGAKALYMAFENSRIASANLSSLTQISGDSALAYAFANSPNIMTVDLSNVTNISGVDALSFAFYGCNSLATIDLSNTTKITGQNACYQCFKNTNIETINLNSLTTVGTQSLRAAFETSGVKSIDLPSLIGINNLSFSYMANGCPSLTSVNIPNLVNATLAYNSFQHAFSNSGVVSVNLGSLVDCNSSGNIFSGAWQNCPNLTSVNLSSLASANYRQVFMNAFRDCPSLTTMAFNSLNVVGGPYAFTNAFTNDSAIEHIYFNAFTNDTMTAGGASIFSNMLYNTGTSITHTVHFPNNIENAVMNTTGYPLFGGESGYVTLAFDLPSTD